MFLLTINNLSSGQLFFLTHKYDIYLKRILGSPKMKNCILRTLSYNKFLYQFDNNLL